MLRTVTGAALLLLAAGRLSPAAADFTDTKISDHWHVVTDALQSAPPSYDAATNTLTIFPKFFGRTPAVFDFYNDTFTCCESVIVNLNLNISSDIFAPPFTHFIADTVTVFADVAGTPPHPTEAHFHTRVPPAPDTEPYRAYFIPQGSTFAQAKPDLAYWTRSDLQVTLQPGQSFSWTESRMHHLDGQFVLVVTPIDALDWGNRLRGLVPGGADASQFAYQNVQFYHFNPNIDGTSANDLLVGNTGNDNITGGFGQDTLIGDLGDDSLDGGDGDDFLFGNRGNDTLHGGFGNDLLEGGDGNDSLHGDGDNDLIIGGRGVDVLEGGTGADRFVFNDADTGVGAGKRDRILDFNAFEGDKIDLSLMDANRTKPGNQAFTWLGFNKKFTKPGQLTAVRSGSTIIIRGNTDGNPRTADFEIQIDHYAGPGTLQASDLIR